MGQDSSLIKRYRWLQLSRRVVSVVFCITSIAFGQKALGDAIKSKSNLKKSNYAHSKVQIEEPKIIPIQDSISELHLGKNASLALREFKPKLKLLKPSQFSSEVQEMFKNNIPDETPMGIVGDFNGDQLDDVIIIGEESNQLLTVGLISTKPGGLYRAIQIKSEPMPILSITRQSKMPTPSRSNQVRTDKMDFNANNDKKVTNDPDGFIQYLGLIPAIHDEPKPQEGEKRFPNEALRIETYLGPSEIYYFKNGTFVNWPLNQ